MRSNFRSLAGRAIIPITLLLLLVFLPAASSASLLDTPWSFQSLIGHWADWFDGIDGGDPLDTDLDSTSKEDPPPKETDHATAGADPNGEEKPTETTGG